MTPQVFAVTPETEVAQIADLFETRGIRRVPVLADGVVVGIVSLPTSSAPYPPCRSRRAATTRKTARSAMPS